MAKAKANEKRPFKEKYRVYITAGITAWIIFMFLHPIGISGSAMDPTLKDGQLVIVTKENFKKEAPPVFSVVNFERSFSEIGENDSNRVRRVIGIPGDTIEIKNGIVYRNNEALEEPYSVGYIEENIEPITLEDGQIYVLGDNREDSLDSRQLGPLEMAGLRGICSWVIWPLGEWGSIK